MRMNFTGKRSLRRQGLLLVILFIVSSLILSFAPARAQEESAAGEKPEETEKTSIGDKIKELWESTGIYSFAEGSSSMVDAQERGPADLPLGIGQLLMIALSTGLIYLAIHNKYEPLLLLPIGFGGILANIPLAAIAGPEGFLGMLYTFGLQTGLFPLLIFMGVGAMTDFGPLIAHPKTALLGAAAQFGIFTTLLGAI